METIRKSASILEFAGARAAASPRRIAPRAARVIDDCRDVALKRICEIVAQSFDQIEDELFGLAESCTDRDLQNLYLDARAQAREKRTAIEQVFRQQFQGEFDRKVAGQRPVEAKPKAKMELSLVDDDTLEESLALSAMANSLKSGAEEELGALNQRLGFLLDEPDLPGEDNPLSPEAVCKALQEACSQISAGAQVKLTLMRLFEQHVARDLPQVYRDVNARLVELHQVLPDIRVTYRAPVHPRTTAQTSRPAVAPPPPSGAPTASASGSHAAGAAPVSPADGATPDLYQLLQGLVQGRAALPAGAAPVGATSALPTEALMGRLSELQAAIPATLPSIPAADSTGAEPSASLTNIPDLARALNVLHEVSARGLAQGASQIDSMTIDIVALLFDYVFNDRQIPDPVKALVARLQIPVLKAALLDKRFFSQKAHPARRLLDSLAELAVGLEGELSGEDKTYQFIERLVTRVQTEFNGDLDLFEESANAVEAYTEMRRQQGLRFDETSARILHDRERREIARLVSENAINERLEESALPPAVLIMLKARWVDVLQRAHLMAGEDGQAWQIACQAVDDLVWSLTAKFGPEERKRLVSMLPRMLRIFQQGLAAIQVEPAERERFFATLVAHHTASIKAGLRPASPHAGRSVPVRADLEGPSTEPYYYEPAPVTEASANDEDDATEYVPEAHAEVELQPGQPGLMRIHLEEDGIKVEELRLARDRKSVVDCALPPELVRGCWVEFDRPEGAVRAKLSWISPHKGMLLFTNPSSSRALSLTPEVFALQWREGRVRIFPDAPLSERAVDSVLEELKAA